MSDVVSFTEIYSQHVELLPGRTLLTAGGPDVASPPGDPAAAADLDVADDGGIDSIESGRVDDNGPADDNVPGGRVDDGGLDAFGGVDDDGPGGRVDDGGRDSGSGVDDDGDEDGDGIP